jgi:hypothetical protein
MGWISDLWTRVSGSTAEDLTFVPGMTIPGAPAAQPITADACYIELYLESLRIEKARRFATQFNGVVYAFQTLARDGAANASLAAVSKPDSLAKLDSSALGNVITVSRKLTGPVPWRGGTLHLELGLFSVKTGNLLSPFLDFVTQVSATAGVSFVNTAVPFLPLLLKGMDLLAGQTEDVALEVAYDADMDVRTSGTYAIIASGKGNIDVSRLTIDPVDRKLLLNGVPLQCGYAVFSIRRTDQKADWGEIPELKSAIDAVVANIKLNNKEAAEKALDSFRFIATTSPDLTPDDADWIVGNAEKKLARAFRPSSPKLGLAGALSGTLSADDEPEPFHSLSDLNLYKERL